jgi:hypothetical protein
MFSDGLLENAMIKKEILCKDAPESIEEIYKVKIGPKLRSVVGAIQNKVSD